VTITRRSCADEDSIPEIILVHVVNDRLNSFIEPDGFRVSWPVALDGRSVNRMTCTFDGGATGSSAFPVCHAPWTRTYVPMTTSLFALFDCGLSKVHKRSICDQAHFPHMAPVPPHQTAERGTQRSYQPAPGPTDSEPIAPDCLAEDDSSWTRSSKKNLLDPKTGEETMVRSRRYTQRATDLSSLVLLIVSACSIKTVRPRRPTFEEELHE
jgi:hypothetical protein